MRNKKAKELRRLFKNKEPWVAYNPITFHKIHLSPKLSINHIPENIVYIIDSITMTDTCGRKLYKGIKKAQYV